MVIRRKRGCLLGHLQAQLLVPLWIITWGAMGHPQDQALLTPYSFIHHKITQNLKTSITQNSTKAFVRSVSKRKQITTISTISNQFIFCSCIISTVFQLFYGQNSSKKTIEPSKQAHNAKKTKFVKKQNSLQQSDFSKTSGTPKILKKRTAWVICILIFCKKNWHFITLS